ncbi:MAG TPA: hypothetical protein VGH19_12615 [Verrucomicrobiae bacterium]
MRWLVAIVLGLGLFAGEARAEFEFDVKLGYDGTVREANWFPAAFEIFNDGPPFSGVIELMNEQAGKGQVRRIPVELPTNTRKRIVVPVFASAGKYSQWRAVVYDEREKKRAEVKNLGIRKDLEWNAMLFGTVARTFGGQPILPDMANSQGDRGAEVVRLDPAFLPDGPIPLEGLQAIYLNSERALEISAQQGAALMAWMQAGGHLIIGMEQPGDLNGLPWLAPLMPVKFGGSRSVAAGQVLDSFAWVGTGSPHAFNYASSGRKRDEAAEFREATTPVFQATMLDGKELVSASGLPLVIRAERGRGLLTVLTFSPEREPFRSWKGRNYFWAQLIGVPPAWFTENTHNNQSYFNNQSIDGVVGAMIDSKQVRKLPVSWLLLLLAVYLVVIGPLDQWYLKKINRQMLTWITFPCYVVGFSLLIYWIGFMLRAGESEWNELHVVDVMPHGGKVELRGRTYASCYSPSNAKYPVATDVAHATFRGEFQGAFAASQEAGRTAITQMGKGFAAEVFVPVWTSQLFVSDWSQSGEEPLQMEVTKSGGQTSVRIENKMKATLERAWIVAGDKVYEVSRLQAGERRVVNLSSAGQALESFVQQNTSNFGTAVEQRRNAFGNNRGNFLPNPPVHLAAASFLGKLEEKNTPNNNNHNYGARFILPEGFDLSGNVKRGQICLLAWASGESPIPALNKFETRRSTRDTLFRVVASAPQ